MLSNYVKQIRGLRQMTKRIDREAEKAIIKKEKTGVYLFGVDISQFSREQQTFLINYRYAKSERECARAMGITQGTIGAWKRHSPAFRVALKRIEVISLQVDAEAAENPHVVEARRQAEDILADVVPAAATELSALIQRPWDECTDRGKSTKLKAVEDALRITGVESKGKGGSGKINILALINEVTGRPEGREVQVIEGEVVGAGGD